MATTYFSATIKHLRAKGTNYTTVHDAAEAEYSFNEDTNFIVGQQNKYTPPLKVWRTCLLFDSSLLPDAAVLISALIKVMPEYLNAIDTHFNVVIVSGAVIEDPPVYADYGDLLSVTAPQGSINTADCVADEWIDIPLDAAGLAAISKTGITKYGVRSSRDIDSIEPGSLTNEWIGFFPYGSIPTWRAPRLYVTYTLPVALPTVATNPATELGAIAAILNGTLNDDGGEVCECGFEFGLDTGYGITTPPQIKVTGETFSQVIGGLAPGTTYHFRAFATNSKGTDYGADRTFATKPVISKAYALAREEL